MQEMKHTDRGRVDKEIVEVGQVLEQSGDVWFIVVQLGDGITEQVQRLKRLKATQVDQLDRIITQPIIFTTNCPITCKRYINVTVTFAVRSK